MMKKTTTNQHPTQFRAVWEGTQFVHHSLAIVNRELCIELIKSGQCELSLIPYETHEFGVEEDAARFPLIQERLNKPMEHPAEFHIRHQWPPNFEAPPSGHWIIMQPWEHGSMPIAWLPRFRDEIDEIWVNSTFVRECYIHDGIDPEKITVIPLAVDHKRFRPGLRPLAKAGQWTRKTFKFLFLGGTLWRKGIDILLDAYCRAFTATDDVVLLIKDMGVDSFYQGQDMRDRICQIQATPNAPEIVYVTETLSDADLPKLYASCDCLVHPYRGEGFGMPIAEAMACSLPVMIPRGGAADDFTSEDTVYYISANWMKVQLEVATVRDAFVLNPDSVAMAEQMQRVVAQPDEAKAMGERAGKLIRSLLSWEKSAAIILNRLQLLKHKPILRFTLKQDRQGMASSKSLPDVREIAKHYNALGEQFYRSGNLASAELQFVRAVQTDPSFAEPRNNLAVLYWQKGQPWAALAQLTATLKLDPDDPDAIINLGLISLEMGRHDSDEESN